MATTQESLNEAVSLVKRMDTHLKKFEKDFSAVRDGLQGGIDDDSKEELELWKPKLEPAVSEIDMMLDACTRALAASSLVNKDQAFMKTHFDGVQKLVKHVVTVQKTYAGWAKDARKLGDDANKALGTVTKTLKSAEADLGTIKNRISQTRNEAKLLTGNVEKWKKICQAAADKHEDTTAEPARLALLDAVSGIKSFVGGIKQSLAEFAKDYPQLPDAMTADRDAQLKVVEEIEKSITAAGVAYLALLDMKKKAMAAKAEPLTIAMPELKKHVAPLLGIDPDDSSKMKELFKVMNSSTPDKWAGEFGRKFQVKNGIDVVRKLEKLPVIAKQLSHH